LTKYELGWLFENEKGEADPVAAIYHYDQYLKLRSGAGNAEIVKQHILACKQELAQTVSLGPVTEKQQREFEQLTEDNRRLREEVEKWRAFYSNHPFGPTNATGPAPVPAKALAASAVAPTTSAGGTTWIAAPTGRQSVVAAPAARLHTIQSGEIPIRIARKYGVKLEALMAANPGVDARRLQPGRALYIPSPWIEAHCATGLSLFERDLFGIDSALTDGEWWAPARPKQAEARSAKTIRAKDLNVAALLWSIERALKPRENWIVVFGFVLPSW
jgi:LysM repeat protein